MNLPPPILEQITEYAKLPSFTPTQIAIALGISVQVFLSEMQNTSSPIYIAYHAGSISAKVEFNQAVQKLSTNGSGPAQSLLHKLNQQAQINNLIDFYNAD